MLIVGGIIVFCVYAASVDGGQSIIPPGFNQILKEWGPFIIIALVVGLFLYRRGVHGSMEESGNLNEIMFGEGRSSGTSHQHSRSLPEAVPVSSAPQPKHVPAEAVHYV